MKKEEEMKSLVKYASPTILTNHNLKNQSKMMNQEESKENCSNTEDILNSILPPREYTIDKNKLYIENVLSTPATKIDVVQLQEELDKRLNFREARENGICPVREDLFS